MDLTEDQWRAIKRCVPARERQGPGSKGGRPWRNPREVINGVLWVMRTGAPWAEMPSQYPPYQTCHRRFQVWVKSGTFRRILVRLRKLLKQRGGVDEESFIDGTYVGAKKGAIVLANVGLGTQRK